MIYTVRAHTKIDRGQFPRSLEEKNRKASYTIKVKKNIPMKKW